MPPRSTAALVAAAAFLLALPSAVHAEEVLRASGTGTALGAMARLAGPFEKAHPGLRLRTLPSVGSGGAFRAVAQGAIDLGFSARPLKPEEYGLGLVALPYARTPFVFAAGQRSGATKLSLAEAVRIYRGETIFWPNGERLRLVLRPITDADTHILQSISPELDAAVRQALAREGMLVALTNQDCSQMLVRTPGTIGPSSLTQILTEGLPVTPLSWNGVAPTVKNMISGAYPLRKTLYLVLKAPASPAVRRFVRFLATPEAQRILEESGNEPLPVPQLE